MARTQIDEDIPILRSERNDFSLFNNTPSIQNLCNRKIHVGVNLAVSFSCIVGCPICKIYLVDHGYRKFKEKIHFMEQYR